MNTPLDLYALGRLVPQPEEKYREQARAHVRRLVKPVGSLGRLEELGIWLAGVQGACPPRPITRPRVVIFAGDHGITQAGVSAYPPETTAKIVRTILTGGAAVNVLAPLAGATIRLVDVAVDADFPEAPASVTEHKVRRGCGRIDTEDALTRDQAEQAFRAGMAIADTEVDSGADLLIPGDVGIGNTTPGAVLVATLTSGDAISVIGRGSGIDDATWIRKGAAIRQALRRARSVTDDPLQLLATATGADFAAMSGFLLQAAIRRTPVLLDGIVPGACALLVHHCAYRVGEWWLAGHRSTEPAHHKALRRLRLEPLLDYGVRLGEGTGALLALPLLRAAAATQAEMATLDQAGIPEPERSPFT